MFFLMILNLTCKLLSYDARRKMSSCQAYMKTVQDSHRSGNVRVHQDLI